MHGVSNDFHAEILNVIALQCNVHVVSIQVETFVFSPVDGVINVAQPNGETALTQQEILAFNPGPSYVSYQDSPHMYSELDVKGSNLNVNSTNVIEAKL